MLGSEFEKTWGRHYPVQPSKTAPAPIIINGLPLHEGLNNISLRLSFEVLKVGEVVHAELVRPHQEDCPGKQIGLVCFADASTAQLLAERVSH